MAILQSAIIAGSYKSAWKQEVGVASSILLSTLHRNAGLLPCILALRLMTMVSEMERIQTMKVKMTIKPATFRPLFRLIARNATYQGQRERIIAAHAIDAFCNLTITVRGQTIASD
jgi:hypothetical protein